MEVDSTYYFLPRREVAKRWVERTPAKFTFDVKTFDRDFAPRSAERLQRLLHDSGSLVKRWS